MQDIFGEIDKGTVIRYPTDGLDAASIVHIDGLTDGLSSSNAFVLDFSAACAERYSVMPCFGKRNYVFSYGSDVGTSRSSITVLIFVGVTQSCSAGDNVSVLSTIANWYDENRVSKGEKVGITIGKDGKYSTGFLISMYIKGYDPGLNAVTATLTFMTSLD